MSAASEEAVGLETHLTRFGLNAFRAGQREVIETVVSGRDCLCVMPTGGGKSLCYQLPAIAQKGLTLVISPLIALMKDQCDQLARLSIPSTFINSTLELTEQHDRLDRMAAGEYSLVYVVPERFRSGRFLDAVRRSNLKLLAIDEAHCISQWGHDFRPDYLKIGKFREKLGNPPTIALTATATDRVQADIVDQLKLTDPQVFIRGFDRPNLFYEVRCLSSQKAKDQALTQFLAEHPGSGIIYAATRKRCEEVAEMLARTTRRRVNVYHAGLQGDDRRQAQDDFMSGRTEIVVATNAFGMGIDKSDVRFVIHYNLPGSLEAYYQEAGRAGRDQKPAYCLLLFSTGDRYVQEFFIESAYPGREMVARVFQFLLNQDADPIELSQQEIKDQLKLEITAGGVGSCEQLLEQAGAVERLLPRENQAIVKLNSDQQGLAETLPPQATTQRKVLSIIERHFVGSRRFENVYFAPADLTALTGLDATALRRAMQQLRAYDWFDYVPPFRGKALRVIKRDTPFDELEIDFATQEARKDGEYEKLDVVMRFARSNDCRQRTILQYFGQKEADRCGHCDNCSAYGHGGPARLSFDSAEEDDGSPRERGSFGSAGGRSLSGAPSLNMAADATIVHAARVALSAVARIKGRFGKQVAVQVLCASNSEKVRKFRLDQLPTYGLLKDFKQTEIGELLDALTTIGLIEQHDIDRFRPVMQLSARGSEVMWGRQTLPGDLPISRELYSKIRRSFVGRVAPLPAAAPASGAPASPPAGAPTSASPPGASAASSAPPRADAAPARPAPPAEDEEGEDEEETSEAVELGALDEYDDGPDEGVVVTPPRPTPVAPRAPQVTAAAKIVAPPPRAPAPPASRLNPPAASSSPSSPPGKSEPPASASSAAGPAADKRPPSERPVSERPDYYWTWRLLTAGFDTQEIMAIRRLDGIAVARHIAEASRNNLHVDSSAIKRLREDL